MCRLAESESQQAFRGRSEHLPTKFSTDAVENIETFSKSSTYEAKLKFDESVPTATVTGPGVLLRVALETPRHARLDALLTYRSQHPLAPGTLVRAPIGKRSVAGVVWDGDIRETGTHAIRPLDEICDAIPPLPAAWRDLIDFSAAYYQRGIGEVALATLPPELRKLDADAQADRLRRVRKRLASAATPGPGDVAPALSERQRLAVSALAEASARSEPGTTVLHGVTGSGKTEVYLHAIAAVLAAGRQAMVLVPEINLTPQLVALVSQRFSSHHIATLHSGLTPAQRLRHWLAAHLGLADVVLGTRLAVFTPMPRLGIVVVDEEHDPSYKQQEGARYSARDLAVWRGRREKALVVLGSATPSLETWQHAETGRYTRLALPERVGGAGWPAVRIVDMNRIVRPTGITAQRSGGPPPGLAPPLVQALQGRLDRGEQSLLFLNRRGYAPVLSCAECGWLSGCPHCSAWRVFHRHDRTLRCHHCGLADVVPRACPQCGNPDIAPVGRGTERVEEQLGELFPSARIARIDADSTRRKGALEAQLAAVHAGAVDILVGTQMIAKGHDFRRITLVAAVNPDASLFSSDFRAPERLFALLMQATGRAGRDAASGAQSEMWVQTAHPSHPLYQALVRHDYAAFAATQLQERESAGLPPYSHLAVLRAEAKTVDAARGFLVAAAEAAADLPEAEGVMVYAPVPLGVARVADVERMQMLVESASRRSLQSMLQAWLARLDAVRDARNAPEQRILRWAVDVDPLTI